MPAPDVQYVLDSSVQCGHIGGDTHFYLMERAWDANTIVDGYDDAIQHDTHWKGLIQMGLYFEHQYLDWRVKQPDQAREASFQGLRSLPTIFCELTRTYASKLVGEKFTGLSTAALKKLDDTYGLHAAVQVMRRTLKRASHDFEGWDSTALNDTRDMVDGRFAENARIYDETVARLTENMHVQISQFNEVWQEAGGDLRPCTPDEYEVMAKNERYIKTTQKMLQKRVAQDRRVVKRSIKFLSKLIGHDNTRMFIGGDNIRIEGRHAIYEIRKKSRLTDPHGGFRALSVFHKEHPDLLLCDMCIFTPNVPLLDHVASLVMHIQSGEEDAILRVGNARNIDHTAYDLEWLAPHLPKKNPPQFVFDTLDGLYVPHHDPKCQKMRRIVARYLFDEVLADFLPLIRTAKLNFVFDSIHGGFDLPCNAPDIFTNTEVAGTANGLLPVLAIPVCA